jgi:hypothetical protein
MDPGKGERNAPADSEIRGGAGKPAAGGVSRFVKQL